MPVVKPNGYRMDRRKMLKLCGAMGVGATFIDPDKLYAADPAICDKIKIESTSADLTQQGSSVFYWIDGVNLRSLSDTKSRVNIAVFITAPQNAVQHVESIVLLDTTTGKTMAARYLDASMKTIRGGYPPIVRFENIELVDNHVYKIVYVVRNKNGADIWVATINTNGTTTLTDTVKWLPQKMRDDFNYFLDANTVNPTPGLFTTPFQFYTDNKLTNHCSRGVIKNIGSDGKFQIDVDFMHGDVNGSTTHYMRYFVILDPVGRLLGFHKRDAEDTAGKNNNSNMVFTGTGGSFCSVVDLLSDNRKCFIPSKKPNGQANPEAGAGTQGDQLKVEYYKIYDEQLSAQDRRNPDLNFWIADIRDCPYIQIYTEDSFDAMARSIIRLR
jgi:hypothetical protein